MKRTRAHKKYIFINDIVRKLDKHDTEDTQDKMVKAAIESIDKYLSKKTNFISRNTGGYDTDTDPMSAPGGSHGKSENNKRILSYKDIIIEYTIEKSTMPDGLIYTGQPGGPTRQYKTNTSSFIYLHSHSMPVNSLEKKLTDIIKKSCEKVSSRRGV
jgi:hypothetical protein